MLKAAIDIGSNSVRLMTARVENGTFTRLQKEIETTRLHEGLDANNMLSDESMARTAAAIAKFAVEARQAGVADENIAAYATSAVRDAANGSEFIAMVKADCGVNIRLLSGVEEANYAFYAAARMGECGVLDIGGASTEMICGRDMKVYAAYSAQMGAVRLRKMLGEGAGSEQMIETAKRVLQPGIDAVQPLPKLFVGVAGTITTLYALKIELKEYSPEAVQGGYVSLEDAHEWLARLYPMSVEERRRLPGMPLRRAEIIDYGIAILISFLELAGLEGIFVSDRDNLYSGIMLG